MHLRRVSRELRPVRSNILPPRLQLPQLPTFPCTVKSTSARSSACNFNAFNAVSALARRARSSASSFSARPQVQSLQALRRLAFGLQAAAVTILVESDAITLLHTDFDRPLQIVLVQQGILVNEFIIVTVFVVGGSVIKADAVRESIVLTLPFAVER